MYGKQAPVQYTAKKKEAKSSNMRFNLFKTKTLLKKKEAKSWNVRFHLWKNKTLLKKEEAKSSNLRLNLRWTVCKYWSINVWGNVKTMVMVFHVYYHLFLAYMYGRKQTNDIQ